MAMKSMRNFYLGDVSTPAQFYVLLPLKFRIAHETSSLSPTKRKINAQLAAIYLQAVNVFIFYNDIIYLSLLL